MNAAMYRDIPQDLRRVVEPVVEDHGLELVDASVRGGRGRGRVQIIVDTPTGDGLVNIDECAAVSREVGHHLDVEDVVPGSYVLEVTSPGIDRTLGREVDFERALGQTVRVETREARDGQQRFKGELVAFDGEAAELATDHGAVRIPFADIAKAQAFAPQDTPSRSRR